MRFLRKLLLWTIGIVVGLIVLAYITGNDHLVRGVRYTYLIGRNSPEIDDRDFFPYSTIPATAPQPWPLAERYGKLTLKPEQEKILRDLGATHVVNSSSPTFMDDLVDACSETGATLGFDAIGGGRIAGQILTAIEQAALRKATSYSRYGSSVHKQVYIYGGLDRGPTEFVRAFGLSWGLGGWLLPNFLERVGPEVAQRLNQRVANEITTTFASHYAKTISLPEMLSLKEIAVYGKQATGEKYLVNPNK